MGTDSRIEIFAINYISGKEALVLFRSPRAAKFDIGNKSYLAEANKEICSLKKKKKCHQMSGAKKIRK